MCFLSVRSFVLKIRFQVQKSNFRNEFFYFMRKSSLERERECWSSVTRWRDYFFDIWLFTKMKICPIAKCISQIRFKSFPITEWTLKMLPKYIKIYQICAIFAKCSHTDREVGNSEECNNYLIDSLRVVVKWVSTILHEMINKHMSLCCWYYMFSLFNWKTLNYRSKK